MTIHTSRVSIETAGAYDVTNLTEMVRTAIRESGCDAGVVTAFVRHTTAAVIISEYEPGILADYPKALEYFVPSDDSYRHNDLNADDNAHSHLLGSILGPSETIPFIDRELVLGTWQRVVLIELDTHPRQRTVIIQVVGE